MKEEAIKAIAKVLNLPEDKPGYIVDAVKELWRERNKEVDKIIKLKELLRRAELNKGPRCTGCGAVFRCKEDCELTLALIE